MGSAFTTRRAVCALLASTILATGDIARAQDTALFNSFLDDWLASIPFDRVLELDVSNETLEYERSVRAILNRVERKEG